ncbi:2-keto-3-deoxygluconate permease [Brucella oryzae]|uniref:2-keto-3-deoxygluconate permease n=1 Tax=Brucella oryzae TaxID=335286 RepID=A0A2S7IZW3_9HYPH|nr:2-keto-3-deoxygluconate permease [Brucella oryzae]PQA73538.1 2-keto-3-deoxygluconate permease [Brucella oryzae]
MSPINKKNRGIVSLIGGPLGKIPGAMMIVPLFLGATINTFWPELLGIGSFTTALFRDGTGALLGLFFFCMGAQIDFRQTSATLQKGTAILLGKAFVGGSIGLLVAFYMPGGTLWGLTPLAIIAGMTNSNSALYVALTKQFGNASDRGAVSVISLNDGPFITLLILGTAGLAAFPMTMLIGCLLPLVIGFIVGNNSSKAREFLAPGEMLLIPFLGFVVGRGIDFSMLLQAGVQGVFLGVGTVICSGLFAMLFLHVMHIITRRPKATRNLISGAAESTVAGNAVATPAAVALLDPSYKAIEAISTSQVAAATITTALLVPFLVMFVARWQQSRGISSAAEEYWINTGSVEGAPLSSPRQQAV